MRPRRAARSALPCSTRRPAGAPAKTDRNRGCPRGGPRRRSRSRPVEWCKSGRVSACGSVVATMP
ncbi:hypothetical protein DKM27_20880 [Mycobacterium tuberculosis variant bovis]|nr:hypothetical protein DKM27_20880 [Mycobacterium tuberculosis variant bovis]